jgi:site-specific recombinase XerD
VRQAIDDWLNDGLDGRSAATVTKYRHVLKPVLEHVGHGALRELTAHDVRHALTALGKNRSSATVAIAHNALTRAIRHAEARDLVRRNVSALIGSPEGQAGRPSQALTLDQAQKLLKTAGDLKKY